MLHGLDQVLDAYRFQASDAILTSGRIATGNYYGFGARRPSRKERIAAHFAKHRSQDPPAPEARPPGAGLSIALLAARRIDRIFAEVIRDDEMRSTAYLLRHNAIVQAQRASQAGALDDLEAGSKKDLVLTRRLWEMPGRVAIYGWHRLDGTPIQPLSLVHGARYADYSHGVRLVWSTAWLDGRPRRLEELLSRPQTAGWLSDEGAIPLLERREELVAAADPP